MDFSFRGRSRYNGIVAVSQWIRYEMKFPQIALTGVLFLGTIATSCNPTAQTSPPEEVAVDYEPPNHGAPGDRQDAGSRPGCPDVETPFTALIPENNWGETMRERPTFWLYVPGEFPNKVTVVLVLREETTQNEVYRSRFQVNSGMIVGLELPENAQELEVDTHYSWRFALFCSPRESDFLSVSGVVVRRELDLEQQELLATATPRGRVAYLATWGLWYDTLTELAALRRDGDSPELAQDWANLLGDPEVQLDPLW